MEVEFDRGAGGFGFSIAGGSDDPVEVMGVIQFCDAYIIKYYKSRAVKCSLYAY